MAFLEGLTILFPITICSLIVLYISDRRNSIVPTNWPVLGAIPAIVVNYRRAHEYATDVLAITGGTFLLKGPMFAKMDMLFTSCPADIHHIMSKNFPNYPKGHKFRQIFDILGDGVSNSDGDIWQLHRKTYMHLFNHPSFHSLINKTVWNKVEKGLLPLLDNISGQGVEIDLQDIFQRFGFDTICNLLIDYDPESMSLDFPYIPWEKALSHAEEAVFIRHVMPEILWKLQRLLNLGNEKRLSNAWKIIDQFMYKHLAEKQKEISNMIHEPGEENYKFLTALMREVEDQRGTSSDTDKFLRDILLNLIIAGRDTTSSTLSWFFYLLAKNPKAEDKIREEVEKQQDKKLGDIQAIDLDNLVYLHGGLCEALRLFPAVPFQHKIPVQPDTLPSGHQVDCNTKIILCFYAMGRMESIWGKDCLEFKPERWFAAGGGIKHQPSYKFPAFNAGPRSCLGKHLSFTQMKIVAATIIYRYHVELVEGQLVVPSNSVLLEMKNGLKVRLAKRMV
ncbi:putative cytochrome P450 [Helianthus debilis subsp. tardiflorus]